jgi:hypothetical protein
MWMFHSFAPVHPEYAFWLALLRRSLRQSASNSRDISIHNFEQDGRAGDYLHTSASNQNISLVGVAVLTFVP